MIIQNYIQCYKIHIHKFYIFLYCSHLILESRSYWSHQVSFFSVFFLNNFPHIGINGFWIFFKTPITLPRPRLSPRGIFKLSYQFLWKKSESESEVAQSCPTLCNPMDCSLPHSSVNGIFQTRVLEWVAISFSRGYSWPRDRTQVSHIVGRCFTTWATREVLNQDLFQEPIPGCLLYFCRLCVAIKI